MYRLYLVTKLTKATVTSFYVYSKKTIPKQIHTQSRSRPCSNRNHWLTYFQISHIYLLQFDGQLKIDRQLPTDFLQSSRLYLLIRKIEPEAADGPIGGRVELPEQLCEHPKTRDHCCITQSRRTRKKDTCFYAGRKVACLPGRCIRCVWNTRIDWKSLDYHNHHRRGIMWWINSNVLFKLASKFIGLTVLNFVGSESFKIEFKFWFFKVLIKETYFS